jgi:hypothetical protein
MFLASKARVRKSDGKVLAVWSTDPDRDDVARGLDGLPPPGGTERLEPILEDGAEATEEIVELDDDHTTADKQFRGPDGSPREVFLDRAAPGRVRLISRVPKGGNAT